MFRNDRSNGIRLTAKNKYITLLKKKLNKKKRIIHGYALNESVMYTLLLFKILIITMTIIEMEKRIFLFACELNALHMNDNKRADIQQYNKHTRQQTGNIMKKLAWVKK